MTKNLNHISKSIRRDMKKINLQTLALEEYRKLTENLFLEKSDLKKTDFQFDKDSIFPKCNKKKKAKLNFRKTAKKFKEEFDQLHHSTDNFLSLNSGLFEDLCPFDDLLTSEL